MFDNMSDISRINSYRNRCYNEAVNSRTPSPGKDSVVKNIK